MSSLKQQKDILKNYIGNNRKTIEFCNTRRHNHTINLEQS